MFGCVVLAMRIIRLQNLYAPIVVIQEVGIVVPRVLEGYEQLRAILVIIIC